MCELPAAIAAQTTLAEQLQHLTETLAAAHTEGQVLATALGPAMTALHALAGTVLMLDLQTNALTITALQGIHAQTVWQNGPLRPGTPAFDVLHTQHALYFEHVGAMKAAYPELEAQTGGVTAVATAVLPLILEGQPLGILILEFKEPHEFTVDERRFLQTLASQTGVALDRARLLTHLDLQVQQRTAALHRQTAELNAILDSLPDAIYVGTAAGITRTNTAALRMFGFQHLDDLNTNIQLLSAQLHIRHPLTGLLLRPEEEAFAIALSGKAHTNEILIRHLTSGEDRLIRCAAAPIWLEDELLGAVAVHTDLTEQEAARQAQLLAHVLNERLEYQVVERTAELVMEQAAMNTFVEFTEAASQIEELDALARLALDTLQSLIPGANVVLTERTPTHWHLRHWTDNLDSTLLTTIQAHGFPLDTPVFADLFVTGEARFDDGWDATRQEVPHTEQFQAVAHYPIKQGGQVVAAIGIAVTNQTHWSESQRAIIRSIGRSFALLYDRIANAWALRSEQQETAHRVQALEALVKLTEESGDTTDIYTLIQRAQVLVLGLLPPGFAAYYEPQDGQWQLRAQTGQAGSDFLQTQITAGFPIGQTASFDLVTQTGQPSFVDVYDRATDVNPEVAQGIAAHATLPLIVEGRIRGIFNVPLFSVRHWTTVDQAVLVTTVQHLGVVIARAERTAQLAHSNMELRALTQELEAFTYSVSHDLRTPVRHVQGFATLAEKEMNQGQLEKVRRYLGIVAEAAERMNTLLDAMLTLSRAGRAVLNIQPVPLRRLVEQAQEDVALTFPDQPVIWEVGALPIIQGDAATLQQVLTHLMENAVKYGQGKDELQVRLWTEEQPDEWTIFVQDTGIGFDPKYIGKLFSIFQRLHSQKEFTGVGIGLATVKRIVTRHGGRVWADGKVGEGATFGFSIPKTVVL